MRSIAHPIGERAAAAFHAVFVVAYLVAAGFHLLCSINHWRDR